MSTSNVKHIETLLQHLGTASINPKTGSAPISVPSMRTSTVRFANLEVLEMTQRRKASGERAITYGRMGLDTHEALEDVFKQLKGGTHCYLASSGMAGITMVMLSPYCR